MTVSAGSAPREYSISAAGPVRRESARRQFLGLLEFSCRLPAGAVPAPGSVNSVHSKKQWDSGGHQQHEQPDSGPAPAEKKRKCSRSGEFRAESVPAEPTPAEPRGSPGPADSQRGRSGVGDAQTVQGGPGR